MRVEKWKLIRKLLQFGWEIMVTRATLLVSEGIAKVLSGCIWKVRVAVLASG